MKMQRTTPQRRLVRSIFEGAHRPLTVNQAYLLARREIPTIGCATVYRSIAILVEEGTLAAIQFPAKSVCYQLVTDRHRHYFLCETCEQIITFENCVDGVKELTPPGCRVASHEIILYGQCQDCLRSDDSKC